MRAIVDTGPLVAFFDRDERHHHWAAERIEELDAPLLVCEPVLTETLFLLAPYSGGRESLFAFLSNGALRVAFRIEQHVGALRRMLAKYSDRPMSLADACVVRMAEVYEGHSVLTLDSDFSIYRKYGRVPLTLIHPGWAS